MPRFVRRSYCFAFFAAGTGSSYSKLGSPLGREHDSYFTVFITMQSLQFVTMATKQKLRSIQAVFKWVSWSVVHGNSSLEIPLLRHLHTPKMHACQLCRFFSSRCTYCVTKHKPINMHRLTRLAGYPRTSAVVPASPQHTHTQLKPTPAGNAAAPAARCLSCISPAARCMRRQTPSSSLVYAHAQHTLPPQS